MNKTVLITGGSSGIGLECARALCERGCHVYEMSRRDIETDGIIHIPGDVTLPHDAARAVDFVLSREGRVDILINNAGMGISGSAEFVSPEDAELQLRVNFLGVSNMCRAALGPMREHGGRIVNVSSVAAVTPIPFQAYYSASKAAVNAYTMALANEVRPFGISVCAVMPGDVQTSFTVSRHKSSAGDTEYSGRIARSVDKMERDENGGMTAAYVGRYIADIALRRHVRPLYTTRFDYKTLIVLAKLLPSAAVNRIIGALYAK